MPIQQKHILKKAIALIQPTHPTFKASVVEQMFDKAFLNTAQSNFHPAEVAGAVGSEVNQISNRAQHKFPPELIIIMDETPVCFDMAANTTVDRQGKEEELFEVQ